MQDQVTAITTTAACELGTHRCKGVVLSLTNPVGETVLCDCPCHGERDGASR